MSENTGKTEPRATEIAISGMSCEHCARQVEESLKSTAGVIEAAVDIASEKARIKYRPAEVDLDELKEAVRKAGYGVVEK